MFNLIIKIFTLLKFKIIYILNNMYIQHAHLFQCHTILGFVINHMKIKTFVKDINRSNEGHVAFYEL